MQKITRDDILKLQSAHVREPSPECPVNERDVQTLGDSICQRMVNHAQKNPTERIYIWGCSRKNCIVPIPNAATMRAVLRYVQTKVEGIAVTGRITNSGYTKKVYSELDNPLFTIFFYW